MTRPLSELASDAVRTGRLLSKNTRPQNVIYPGLLAATIAYLRHASLKQCVACYVLLLCLYGVAASLNNVADIRTDTLNRRTDNPMVGGLLRRRDLSWFVLLALIAAVVLQEYLSQPYSGVIAVVYVALSFAYSDKRLNLQARGIWGTGVLCLCYSTLPFLLGMYQAPLHTYARVFWIAVWTAIATAPIILAKDYKDVAGDKETGKMTPLVRFGTARLTMLTYGILALAIIIYTTLSSNKGTALWVSAAGSVVYVLLTVLLHLRQGKMPKTYKSALMLALIVMVALLV